MPHLHPRLLFGAEQIQSLKNRLHTPDTAAELAVLRSRAQALLSQALLTEEYANAAMTQHGNFYELGAQITDFAETFGILYALGETDYTEKMKQALLHYATFNAWTGPANRYRKTPWLSDLSTTRLLYGFALAYDIFYDELSETERATVRHAMLTLGIRPLLADWVTPGKRIHALDSMGHNWWAVCIAFAGIGLCAIHEDVPDASELFSGILASLRAFCDYRGDPLLNKIANFDSKGMFYESTGYFNYGAGELCRFLYVYSRCFPGSTLNDFPILRHVGAAYLSLVYPVSDARRHLYLNFGDSALSSAPDSRDGMTMLPQYLLLLGLGNENLRRYYARAIRKRNFLDLLYPELCGSGGSVSQNNAPCLPDPIYPTVVDYPDTGLAMWRSGAAVDGTLFSVRCGFTWNHAHDDAGTFILLRNGENVLCDSGTVSYGKSDYISHYCAAPAHNVVTVDGRGQQKESLYRGNKFPGRLLHTLDQAPFTYLLADATGPMCDTCLRNHRSFLRLGEEIFVTVDDLYTYEPTRFSYLLHHPGEATLEKGSIRIRTDKNALRVHTVSPVACSIRTDSYEGLRYVAVEPDEPARLCNLMHVIAPEELGVTVQAQDCPDGYGVRITVGADTYELYYNYLADGRCMHINSNTTLGGYDTDAYLLCIHRDESGHEQVLMVYGSYLRQGEHVLHESFEKTTRVVSVTA